MKRALITATVAIAIIAFVGGGVLLWMENNQKDSANDTSNTNSPATNTGADETNTNARVILTRDEKGTIEVNKSVTYRDTTLQIANASLLDRFHGENAGSGNQYVVLFLKPLTVNDANPNEWIATDVKLRSGVGTSSPLLEAEIVGASTTVDTGYLWFQTALDAKDFTLMLTSGENEASLPLGF